VALTTMRLARRTMTAMTIAVARIELPTGRTEGEVGRLAFRCLTFGPRQRRADQRTMDGPIVTLVVLGDVLFQRFVGRAGRLANCIRRVRSASELCLRNPAYVFQITARVISAGFYLLLVRDERGLFDYRSVIGSVVLGLEPGGIDELRGWDYRLFAASGRHLGLLVFVLRVARGAPRLLDGVVDHRDDRVIGDAALTRTVVVQNVTEPKPALLHENSP
jgi:hypothetical protein